MRTMTEEEKLKKYEAGLYRMAVPPVSSLQWEAGAWITWIDYTGEWLSDNPEDVALDQTV